MIEGNKNEREKKEATAEKEGKAYTLTVWVRETSSAATSDFGRQER